MLPVVVMRHHSAQLCMSKRLRHLAGLQSQVLDGIRTFELTLPLLAHRVPLQP